ncbi:MAG: hypothetical protein ABL907_00890, partial [Hyphomicrobium sp.]
LITERVRCEFEKNFASDHALVQLSDLGEAQVGKLVERALIGFAKRAFLLIIDGRQVVDLDTTIRLQPRTEVTFIRLVQLVGG